MTQLSMISGVPFSPLCFATMQFGGTAAAVANRAMHDACREQGVNFFDTAHVYAVGVTETLLAQFTAEERDDIFVAAKVA